MDINFDIKINSTCYFTINANIRATGHGVISIDDDNLEFIQDDLSKDEFIDWLYDTYLLDMGYDEDNITLDKDDVELSYKKYLETHE